MANSERQFRLLSKRYLPHFAAMFVAVLATAGFMFLSSSEKERNLLRYRSHALSQLEAVSEQLENILNSSLSHIEGLSAFVSIHPEITKTEFDEFVKQMIEDRKSIHSIELVKGTVISNYIYPLKDNESAIGVDLMSLPADRETVRRAIDTRKTVIAGPLNLVQGGTGIIARSPIFISSGKKLHQKDKYWGLAQVIIIPEAVFKEAGLYDKSSDLYFAIRGKDAKGAAGDVFFGDKAVFQSDPLTLEIPLFNGSWRLGAVPKAGWKAVSVIPWWLKALRLTIPLILGSLVFLFLRSQQNILKSEKRFYILYESSRDAVMTLTPGHGFLGGNPAAVAIFGCHDEREFTDLSPASVSPEFQPDGRKSLDKAQEMMQLAVERGSHFFEWTHKRVDGTEFFADVLLTRMESNGKNLLQATVRDITERKRAENAIREDENRLRSLTQTAVDAIISADTAGNIISWNKGAQAIFGYGEDEALGKPLAIMIPERYRDAHERGLERVSAGGEPRIIGKTTGLHGLRKDGSEFPLELSLATWKTEKGVFFTGIIRDITERKKLEAELEKSRRLEAIGTLAGGMAHDFNNLLTAILGNIAITKMHMNSDNKDFDKLTNAENACMKAAELTKRLITFSKGGDPVLKPVSISEIATEAICPMVSGSDITCECLFPEHLYPVYVDEGQIRQVFRNMAINAKEAMPHGGVIRIDAENITLGKGDIAKLKEGKYVKISIKDSGKGIPEDILPKIFDPYFTTKEMGAERGLGLGLAVCFSIVKKHNGHIAVESKTGEGTTFHIYLPASEIEIKD